jgi:mono/diheme cytochrome c family protein
MRRIAFRSCIMWLRLGVIALLVVVAAQALTGCNYSRMRDDEAVQAYNQPFPKMPKQTIPIEGGIWIEREADPSDLVNAAPQNAETVALGAERYGFYCIQCHGPRLDGNGTVGQSFSPLPANLKNRTVQDQTDGEIFYKIRFGYNRHPPLYSTVTDEETWAVIRYMRTLRERG